MEYLSEMAANLWEKYIYYGQLYIYMEYFTMKYYCQYNYSIFVCSLIIYRMYNIELTSSFFSLCSSHFCEVGLLEFF